MNAALSVVQKGLDAVSRLPRWSIYAIHILVVFPIFLTVLIEKEETPTSVNVLAYMIVFTMLFYHFYRLYIAVMPRQQRI